MTGIFCATCYPRGKKETIQAWLDSNLIDSLGKKVFFPWWPWSVMLYLWMELSSRTHFGLNRWRNNSHQYSNPRPFNHEARVLLLSSYRCISWQFEDDFFTQISSSNLSWTTPATPGTSPGSSPGSERGCWRRPSRWPPTRFGRKGTGGGRGGSSVPSFWSLTSTSPGGSQSSCFFAFFLSFLWGTF